MSSGTLDVPMRQIPMLEGKLLKGSLSPQRLDFRTFSRVATE
jgi:hypothetical protein